MNRMIKCPKCNADVPNDARFCSSCGTKFNEGNFCPSCGQQLSPNDKFCTKCGAKIDSVNNSSVANNTNKVATPSPRTNNSQRNIVIAIVVAIILIGGIAAYYFSSQKPKSDNIVCAVDSITSAADTVECAIDTREQYYGDGATFEVRGHVKSIEDYEDFDNNGRFIPSEDYIQIKRNSKGQITEIDHCIPDWPILNYRYNSEGIISEIEESSNTMFYGHSFYAECDKVKHKYKYDSDGYICSDVITIKYGKGNRVRIDNPQTFTYELKYEILEKDKHANWIKRRISGEGIGVNYRDGFEVAGENIDVDVEVDSTDNTVYYAKKKIDYVEERKITYYGESSPSTSSKSSSSSNSSSSNTSSNSNSKYSQREQELLEENKRLCNEWTRYENALTKAMNEFDYNYKHGYPVVQSFGDMQFCVNKLDEIADGLSRIDSRTGSIFKDKVKKYKDGLEYCKVHSGYYR